MEDQKKEIKEEDLSIPPIFQCGIFKIAEQQPNDQILVKCLHCPAKHRLLKGNTRETSNFRQHIKRMHHDLLPLLHDAKEQIKIKREIKRNERKKAKRQIKKIKEKKSKRALTANKKIFVDEKKDADDVAPISGEINIQTEDYEKNLPHIICPHCKSKILVK